MKAYYGQNGVVVLFSREENAINLPSIDVGDYDIIKDSLGKKLIAVVRNGTLIFERDKASIMSAVRQNRKVLLDEADSYRQKLIDNSLIKGIECDQSELLRIAIYRKALRDIVEAEQISWPERPW